jgi:hypothetical protein
MFIVFFLGALCFVTELLLADIQVYPTSSLFQLEDKDRQGEPMAEISDK